MANPNQTITPNFVQLFGAVDTNGNFTSILSPNGTPYSTGGGGGSTTYSPLSFSTAIDLSTNKVLTQTSVTGAIVFSTTGTPTIGTQVILRLIANGINAPDLTSFKEVTGSSGYSNIANVVNILTFTYDGTDYLYNVNQRIGDNGSIDITPPTIQSITVTSATPTIINVVMSKTLSIVPTLLASSFVISGKTIASIAYASSTQINITLSAAVAQADVMTASYTLPIAGSQIKDLAGNLLATISGISVTNSVLASIPLLRYDVANQGVLVESGSAGVGYSYAPSNTAANADSSTQKILIGKDGYIDVVIGSITSQGTQIGIASVNTNINFNLLTATYSMNTSPGAAYSALADWAVTTSTDGTAATVTAVGAGITRNGTTVGNCATGDILRIERRFSSTTPQILVQISKDSGATFTVRHTLTSPTNIVKGDIFPWFRNDGSSAAEVTAVTKFITTPRIYSAP